VDYTSLISELSALLHDDSVSAYSGDGWRESASGAPAAFPVTQAAWRSQHLTPGRTSAELLDGQDPDNDGIANELEYAFGTHPLVTDTSPLTTTLESGQLKMTFPVVSERSDVTVAAETSTDITTGWTTSGVTTSTSSSEGNKTIKQSTIDALSARGFLRVAPQ
jgi:hypothetical protein